MREIINEYGDTKIKKGRKYYHIEDSSFSGSVFTCRTKVLDEAFIVSDFQAFSEIIKRAEQKLVRYGNIKSRFIN